MAYVTPSAVLQEAGLWNQTIGETLSGTVNGSNKVFTTTYKPLVPRTSGASVSTADVAAYVNGSPATVTAVDATTGAITLQTAPTTGQVVTADYAASPIDLSYVTDAIDEADEVIDDVMSAVVTTPYTVVPKTIRKVARYYAAGLLMGREYGLEMLTEDTTKEGSTKIKQAEAWLDAYRARIESNNADTTAINVPRATDDQRLFDTYDTSNGRWIPPTDSGITVNRRTY